MSRIKSKRQKVSPGQRKVQVRAAKAARASFGSGRIKQAITPCPQAPLPRRRTGISGSSPSKPRKPCSLISVSNSCKHRKERYSYLELGCVDIII